MMGHGGGRGPGPETRPPPLARAFLDWLLPPWDAAALIGDLDEEFNRFVLPARGPFRARLWYWRQAVTSAPGIAARRAAGFLPIWPGELRQAARALLRRPGFTLAVIGTLALGIGVNTAVFSVVNAVVVRPLPYQDADRLVRPVPDELFFLDIHDALALEERVTTLEGMAPWGRSLLLFESETEAEEVRGGAVSWDHFRLLGVRPILGRPFRAEDAESGDALILSHALWTRRYGGDPGVVGSRVDLSGGSYWIAGIMGPDHVPMEYDWEAWVPLPSDPALAEGRGLATYGRLRDGVTVSEAEEEIRRVLVEIFAEGGHTTTPEELARMNTVPLRDWLLGDATHTLLVLLGAVGFVLLLACANVTNLLLVHNGERAQEYALRTALGGGRAAVFRSFGAELLILTAASVLVGVGAAWATSSWVAGTLPPDLPRSGAVGISPGVVFFGILAGLAAAVAGGILPLLRVTGMRGTGSLNRGGRTSTPGRRRVRVRGILVAAEVSVSVVLVLAAGLMVRSFLSLRGVDPGFQAQGLVTVRPSPPRNRYPDPEDLTEYYRRLVEELSSLPQVSSVGGIQFLPMTPGGWWSSYRPEGVVLGEGENRPRTAVRVVLPGYFLTMGQPVEAGRPIAGGDAEGEEILVNVNRTLAQAAFPAGKAVGRLLHLGGSEATRVRIAGVVGDVRQSDLRSGAHPEMYLSFEANPWRRVHMVLRVEGDPEAALGSISQAVRRVDPRVHLEGPRLMTDVVDETLADTRLLTFLLSFFGFVALGLGGIGVYGVTSSAMEERRRELGIRVALGAEPVGLTVGALLRGLVPVLFGLALGLGGALALSRVLEGVLFGVGGRDLETYLAAPVVILAVAALSLAVPALRAGRVDPAVVLKEE